MPPGMPAPMGGAMGAAPAPPPPPAPPAEPQGDGSYEICLKVMPDGTFQVYKESEADESSEPSEPGGEDLMSGGDEMAEGGKGETFDNIEDALRGVVKLYRSNPVSGGPMDQMKAGYGAEEGR